MNTWLKYLLPLSIISINGWAAEPYQMQLPLKPSVLVEAAQKNIPTIARICQNYWQPAIKNN